MAGGHFGQVHVRRQANFLDLGRLIRTDGVVEVFADRIGVELAARAGRRRRRRVTVLIRSISSCACSLSATFWPISLA
jgi:hypothetical protein